MEQNDLMKEVMIMNNLSKSIVSKFIDNYLIYNKKIIKLEEFTQIYLSSLGKSEKINQSRETNLEMIQKYGSEYLLEDLTGWRGRIQDDNDDELSRLGLFRKRQTPKIPIIKIETPQGIFFTSKETINEIRKIGRQLINQQIINVEQLGNRGLSNIDMNVFCEKAIPDFQFVKLIGHPELLLNKNDISKFTCKKCGCVELKLIEYYGFLYCPNCMKKIQESEKSSKGVVVEVNPYNFQMSNDMEDIFTELDLKEKIYSKKSVELFSTLFESDNDELVRLGLRKKK